MAVRGQLSAGGPMDAFAVDGKVRFVEGKVCPCCGVAVGLRSFLKT